MAAFPHPYYPFLLDSVFHQNNNPIKMHGFADNTSFFSQFYQSDHQSAQTTLVNGEIRESSCLDLDNSSSKGIYSDNETSMTKKQSTDSSSVVDRLESGEEQVTQKISSSMEKKRKNRDQTKDARKGKGKKQSKCNNKKVDEEETPPLGYIHVRARRGQATDSHSLAERVRREKISERMKLLQTLVPGCDKVIGKAHMLDEIINYVQSLQNQVEFLSMKLASLNPMIYDFGVDQDDAFMVRPEKLNNLESSTMVSQQHCSPIIQPTFTIPPTIQYSLDDPPMIVLPQGHRLNPFSQQLQKYCQFQ